MPVVSDIVARPGGVMTDEVGTVTGELTLRSAVTDGTYVLQVQYKDADEWYTVTGTKIKAKDPKPLHALAVALLRDPA